MACIEEHIDHRLTAPATPKTNGMVERVNGTINESNLKANFYLNYNPRDVVNTNFGDLHRYCDIVAPDIHNDGINLSLTFTATFKPLTGESCSKIRGQDYAPAIFYATWDAEENNFGPPIFLSSPDNYVIGTNDAISSENTNNRVPRIDSEQFTENGITYWSYTWFTGNGNANSTVNLLNNEIINNTYPNFTFDEGITEAPFIFKRNSIYYFLYSENNYDSKYQMYYKKATSLSELSTNTNSCRLTFNSWETRPDKHSHGYNAGHGSVIQIGTEYYLIYHIGNGNFERSVYVSKLEFVGDEIKQIPAPSFIGGGEHVGNLFGCAS